MKDNRIDTYQHFCLRNEHGEERFICRSAWGGDTYFYFDPSGGSYTRLPEDENTFEEVSSGNRFQFVSLEEPLFPTTDDVQIAETSTTELVFTALAEGFKAMKTDHEAQAASSGQRVIQFDDGTAVRVTVEVLSDYSGQVAMLDDIPLDNRLPIPEDPIFQTLGGRLGALVVEFSETLDADQKAEVLTQLDESTDSAYAQAALDMGLILQLFSHGPEFPKEGQ